MNKHTKLAIFVAPFLLVGGYIAADYYAIEKEKQKNLFKLNLLKRCNLYESPCLVANKQLELKISHSQGVSSIKSSHSLDSVVFSVLDSQNNENAYPLVPDNRKQLWQSSTRMDSLLENNSSLTVRVIATVNKGYYFSEFTTQRD